MLSTLTPAGHQSLSSTFCPINDPSADAGAEPTRLSQLIEGIDPEPSYGL